MCKVKRSYIGNLGNVPPHIYGLVETEKLEKKLDYCREYLALLDKFHPGCNYQVPVVLIHCQKLTKFDLPFIFDIQQVPH